MEIFAKLPTYKLSNTYMKTSTPHVTSHQSASLSEVLLPAADCVRAVLAGRSLTDALAEVDPSLRASVQSISFYTMRQLATAQALSAQLLTKKAPNPMVHALLLTSLCLLSVPSQARDDGQQQGGEQNECPEDMVLNQGLSNELNKEPSQVAKAAVSLSSSIPAPSIYAAIPYYAAHTVVDQTVKAAQNHKKCAPFKGLLNACLRRFLREKSDLMQQALQDEQVRYGFPSWWIGMIRKAYPEQWQAILASANTPGPLTLRINRRQGSRTDFCQLLEQANMGYECVGEDAVVLQQAVPVSQIPGFEQGLCAVQDAGAQLAAQLLPLQDGMRVLDACAAPGGKTAHILERADVQMWALDIEPQRLARVQQNLMHLQLMSDKVHLLQADAADTASWWDGQYFDVIMADVPCTASGIVRRHPDIKWLRQYEDIGKTAALQRQIVQALWQTLAPGGYFLYITCSIFPQEGEEQAAFIMQALPDAQRLAAPGQLLPIAQEGQMRALHDGFFYALFRKG